MVERLCWGSAEWGGVFVTQESGDDKKWEEKNKECEAGGAEALEYADEASRTDGFL